MADLNKMVAKVIAQAWSDADFKAALIANPVGVLREQGFDVPADMQVRVVEDSPNLRTLVIPPAPTNLTEEDLDKVAGGGDSWSVVCRR